MVVISTAFAILAAITYYTVFIKAEPTEFALILLVALSVTAAGFGAAAFLPGVIQKQLLAISCAVVLGVYLTELYFVISSDYRSRIGVIGEMRTEGKKAYSALEPTIFTSGRFDDGLTLSTGEMVIPVAGIANVNTVICNETGTWISARSDRFGFNNPDGVWGHERLDVALVGDSFTHGYCVTQEQTIAGQLRRRFPMTQSLGYGGNGPLLELASIKEILKPYAPRHVFWLYTPTNDLSDLDREARHPILRRYIEPGYRQNLRARFADLQKQLRDFHAGFLAGSRQISTETSSVIDILLLRNSRRVFRLDIKKRYVVSEAPEGSVDLFKSILALAKKEVGSWDGRLYLVYLPSGREIYEPNGPVSKTRTAFLEVTQSLRLDVIDLLLPFRSAGNPRALFNSRNGHYSVAGYAIVAAQITKHLNAAMSLESDAP